MQPPLLTATLIATAAVAAALAAASARLQRRVSDDSRLDLRGIILATALLAGPAIAGAAAPMPGFALALAAFAVLLLPTDRIRGIRGLRLACAAAFVAAISGGTPLIDTIKLPFTTRFVDLGWAGWLLSIAWTWLFGAMFARAGTVPGAASGIAAVAALTFAAIGFMHPDVVGTNVAALSLAISLACLGMLPFAAGLRSPQTSAGAFALGMAIGAVACMGMVKNAAALAVLVPLLVVGMPLFAAAVPGRRSGRPAHLHEVLLSQGYSPRQVAGIVVAGTAYLCALAILLAWLIELHWLLKLAITAAWIGIGLPLGWLFASALPRPALADQPPLRLRLFGVPLDALTMDQALDIARRWLREGGAHYIVTCDASGLVRATEDAQFRSVVEAADMVTADGAGVVLAARILGLPVAVRVAGCDLVEGLCRVAAEEGRSVYFLGAEPGVAELAARRLQERIPGLRVAGCHHGYYDIADEPKVVEQIAAARPAVLFVALGQPRQELFIAQHLQRIGANIAIGIGGSLDVISGRKKRAPRWMQRLGLEWLYRVAREPWRLPRLRALPKVIWLAFRELLRPPRPGSPPGASGGAEP